MYYNTDSGQGSIFFPAKETTTVNGVFVYPKTTEPMPSDKIYFDLSIKEVPATFTEPTSGATGFTWDEITLPLVANLSFDPSLPGVDSIKPNYNFEIARGFKLTLTERTEVTYTYGVDPVALNNFALYVYTDESLTECVSPNYSCRLDPENKVILNPGTYYVVVTDGGVRSWSGKILSGPLVIKGTTNFTEESVITIQELLDSNVPTISYTNDLAYSKSTYYIDGLSATVKGETGLFQWNGSNYYAAAYKLTGMNVNDSVNIVEYSNPRNEGIYIYKKAEDGTVTRVAYNESSTWLTDSDWSNKISLKFTADAASDYYVVVSPASDKKYIPLKTAYNTIIWTEGEEPQPQAPQLPDEMKIVSTQASESQITVPENATEEQIRQALIALGITGTNALNETVNIKNNPYSWAISADETSATYTKLVMPYTTADTYTGAVVLINYETGLSEINAVEVKLAPNPAKDFITILGLKGGETVRIFDIQGRLILTEKVTVVTPQINITMLKAGVYLVQISGDGKTRSVKLIVTQ
jgi:hypothetical protein